MLGVALTLLILRLRRDSLIGSRPWNLLVSGVSLYTAGCIVWYLLPLLTDRPLPFPSPIDATFFAAYLLYALFLLGLLHRRYLAGTDSPRAWVLPLVDAGIFTCAAAGVLWPLLFTPTLDLPGVGGLTMLTAAGYPLLTAGLFALVVQLLAVGRRPGGEEVLLAVWVGGELVGVTFYGVASAAGSFHFSHPMVLTWLVSYAALAAAAVHPSLTTPRPDRGRALTTRRWWSWLLLPAVLSPAAVGLGLAGSSVISDRPPACS